MLPKEPQYRRFWGSGFGFRVFVFFFIGFRIFGVVFFEAQKLEQTLNCIRGMHLMSLRYIPA